MKLHKITDTYAFLPQALLEVRVEGDVSMLQARDMQLDKRMVLAYGPTARLVDDLTFAIKTLEKLRTQATKEVRKLEEAQARAAEEQQSGEES